MAAIAAALSAARAGAVTTTAAAAAVVTAIHGAAAAAVSAAAAPSAGSQLNWQILHWLKTTIAALSNIEKSAWGTGIGQMRDA